MFRKPRMKSLTISAELHEKIARNSVSIYQAESEVLCVRPGAKSEEGNRKQDKKRRAVFCYLT